MYDGNNFIYSMITKKKMMDIKNERKKKLKERKKKCVRDVYDK